MKSWPELVGSGNPEAHDYGAGGMPVMPLPYKDLSELTEELNARYAAGERMKVGPELTGYEPLEVHEYDTGLKTENMVERVTIALAKSYYQSQPQRSLQRMARAAIAAMREPTPEILQVIAAPFTGGPALSETKYWNSLIDAALKE